MPTTPILLALCACLACSVALTALIVRLGERHRGLQDSFDGPHKFHSRPTPRVGGVAVFASLLLVSTIAVTTPIGMREPRELLVLLLCAVPAFGAGLGEDLTKRVGVATRLGCAMLSGAIAFHFAGAGLNRLDVSFLDGWLTWNLFALALTSFAVAGIANAMNIIDGYNGLASGYAIAAFSAIAFVASRVGDSTIVFASLAMVAAIAGFIVWNFPFGRVFLGDSGAYFIGFMVAELSVLLVQRNATVSPWFPLMIVAYPAWETLFSIYRKKFVRGQSPGRPDGLHLHMLVYKRLVRWRVGSNDERDRRTRNSLTSPYLWALSAVAVVAAIGFWQDSLVLATLAFAFGGLYNWLYRAIVRFRVPAWLVVRRATREPAAAESLALPDEERLEAAEG